MGSYDYFDGRSELPFLVEFTRRDASTFRLHVWADSQEDAESNVRNVINKGDAELWDGITYTVTPDDFTGAVKGQ